MKISVIIPTYNAGKYLENLLKKLRDQTVRPHEIIVIDSESADNTRKIAEKYRVKFFTVAKAGFDHGGTRTIAGKKAKGDVLVYMTQDALPYDHKTLEWITRPFRKDERIGAVYGRQVAYPGASPFAVHSRLFGYPEKSFVRVMDDKRLYKIKTAFLSNAFTAYKRTALAKTGWFKSNLISTEDTYAGAKMLLAGYRLAYSAEARVFHSHDYSVWQEFKRYFDIGSFHKNENWIIREFGKANDEGFRYVVSEWKYLVRHKKFLRIPEFFVRNMLKYIGYRMGYHHERFPAKLVLFCSMHRGWWIKNGMTGRKRK